jgi:hypothetical protein
MLENHAAAHQRHDHVQDNEADARIALPVDIQCRPNAGLDEKANEVIYY